MNIIRQSIYIKPYINVWMSLLCFILPCHEIEAQTSAMNKGYVVYKLGTDTTFIGFYQVHNNNFQFKVMSRPNLSVSAMNGSLFPNGELKESTGYTYTPTLQGEEKRLVDYHLSVQNDSTYIKQLRDGKETVIKFPGKAMVANALGSTFIFFLPLLIPYAPKNEGETVDSYHFVLGQKRPFTIKRISATELEMGSLVMGYFKLYLQPDGKLKSIDGIGSSWNLKGEHFDDLDLDAFVRDFVREEEMTPLKPLNKKDSVTATINGINIRIDYSRPSKRGRIIYGEVVPWNRVWRTGANEPTKLTIDNSIYFDGKEVPPGTYSLFTLPAKEGWTLIINKQTNMWGTDYDSTYDLLRVPMKSKSLKESVEMMTIGLSEKNKKGILSVSWDKTKLCVPFKLKK